MPCLGSHHPWASSSGLLYAGARYRDWPAAQASRSRRPARGPGRAHAKRCSAGHIMVGQQADTAVQHTGHRAGRMAPASSAAAIGAPGSLTLSIIAAVAARSRAYARSERRGSRLAVVTALAGLIASFGSPQASAAAVTNRLQLCGAPGVPRLSGGLRRLRVQL